MKEFNAENIAKEYEQEIIDWLKRWGTYLKEKGYSLEENDPYGIVDEEFNWELFIRIPKDMLKAPYDNEDSNFSIRFTLGEEKVREDINGKGLAPIVSIWGEYGLIIDIICPNNWTKELWIYNNEDFRERMYILTNRCLDEIIAPLQYYIEDLRYEREREHMNEIKQERLKQED